MRFLAASALASGLLLMATPALAESRGNNGWHLGAFLSAPLVHLEGGSKGSDNDGDDKGSSTSTDSTSTPRVERRKFDASGTAEIGVVSGVNGSVVTLSPAINLSGTGTAATSVVTNASTTFRGGASSTASLTSGERVIIVGTSSTSTPNVITASIVIAFQNILHFWSHFFKK